MGKVFSNPVSLSSRLRSSVSLEPHPKHQHTQESVKHATTQLRDLPAITESMADEAASPQQTTAMGGETARQSTVYLMDENAKDNSMEKMIQEIVHDHHINTMSGVVDATAGVSGITVDPDGDIGGDGDAASDGDPNANAATMITTAPMSSSALHPASIDDNHDHIHAMSSLSPPHAAIHHNTRQFTIPPINIPYTTRPATRRFPYHHMVGEGKSAIVPSMMLCVLANNPKIMLPLASLQTFFFDHIHALNKENFHLSCNPMPYFSSITKVITSVVCSRIRYALHALYPMAGIYEDNSNDDELEAMALELERGPVDVLESIVRDGLAVCNPIRVLITHLEAVTMHYSKCTTRDGQETLRHSIVKECRWMEDITTMALVFGHYLWDTQWVSDQEWDTFVKYMTILTTDIFPEAYTSLFQMDSGPLSTLTKDDHDIIYYFKHILGIVSCCFLSHYRPVKSMAHIPHRKVPTTSIDLITLPRSVYDAALTSSTAVFKQCVMEYMDHPAAFSQFSSMMNLLQITTTTDKYASPRDYIMSQVELACNSHKIFPPWFFITTDRFVDWMFAVPLYHRLFFLAFYLADRVVHAPPSENPAYEKIATIYPTVANRVTLIGYRYSIDDPQYQQTPVYRTSDGSDLRPPPEEVQTRAQA